MAGSDIYDELDEDFRKYVDVLVDHAHAALWPERRAALSSFWRGIAGNDPDDLKAALRAVGLANVVEDRLAETVFRVVLTAYLERLDDSRITNPDQAALFSLSLRQDHVAAAAEWLEAHPEHRVPEDGC